MTYFLSHLLYTHTLSHACKYCADRQRHTQPHSQTHDCHILSLTPLPHTAPNPSSLHSTPLITSPKPPLLLTSPLPSYHLSSFHSSPHLHCISHPSALQSASHLPSTTLSHHSITPPYHTTLSLRYQADIKYFLSAVDVDIFIGNVLRVNDRYGHSLCTLLTRR